MNITGKIVAMGDVISGESPNGQSWSKQTVVVEYNPEYHKLAAVEFYGEDRIGKLKQCKVGDLVTLDFAVESYSYNGRWFASLKGYGLATYTPR